MAPGRGRPQCPRRGRSGNGPGVRQLWAPWRMAYVSSGPDPADGGCFLCAAANAQGSEASLVVDRAELTLTLLNRYPYSSGHLMVAPLRHTADLVSLTV